MSLGSHQVEVTLKFNIARQPPSGWLPHRLHTGIHGFTLRLRHGSSLLINSSGWWRHASMTIWVLGFSFFLLRFGIQMERQNPQKPLSHIRP